ncbi:glycoside hydrolase family 43 protein-like protein [Microdochium bolleyi]|uniref:Endo-1,5-alpha-L-arabinanase A n=1 Tax=Microdochium bolleyi TaxID=196109 RepID=A0A136J8G6_9PEZI|nr:glycoside hydrolase family 43 protein-like protein [Microdochium bolleyi]
MRLSHWASALSGLAACTSAYSIGRGPTAGYERSAAQLAERQAAGNLEAYVFAYFTGNSRDGEKIYLAASRGNNALQWDQLNGGRPVLTSTQGTRGLRDPFLLRSNDGKKFFLIATDLSIGSGTSWGDSVRTGSLYLEIWESSDLVNWSAQRHVKVSPNTAGNTWAPEAYWDDTLKTYVVFWASSLYADNDPNHTGNTYHRMLYATTSDFVTFSAPKVWQDAGTSRIDSTVIKVDGVYHRFTKDEGAGGTGCTDIIQERSTSLTATLGSWTREAACIGRDAGTSAVEGPTVFRANAGDANGQNFYLFVDEYGGRGYIPLATKDISKPTWRVPSSYSLPTSPRHGSVVPITAAELAKLKGSLGTAAVVEKKSEASSTLSKRSTIIPGLYADPNIAIFGKTAYIYATTDGTPGWGGNTFYVWKSNDLRSWTRSAQPFLTLNGTSGNVPWASGNAWAPTIIERGGKHYFYFSGHNPTYNRKTIGVAVSTSGPEGPFVAQPQAMILNNESQTVTTGQAIDPAAFRDPQTGKYYLYWGNGKPVAAELNDDMVSINWSTLTQLSGLNDFREGTFVAFRKGLYHVTYSIDDTGSENYRIGYATSTKPLGPFTNHGLVLSKDASKGILGTGHNSVVQIPGTDEWYIAYHRFKIPGGDGTNRETTVDKMYYDDVTGLMKVVVPTVDGPPARPL